MNKGFYKISIKLLGILLLTKRIIEGGNYNLSPLLTLIKRKDGYFIYSFLTSPPHNGIVEMPIQKIK